MSVRVWTVAREPEAEFLAAWAARVARAPHANFSMDPAYLRWEARHGRGGLAVLVDEGGTGGAFVLRESGRSLVSGWPWRWQAVIEDPSRTGPTGLAPDEGAWLLDHARRIVPGRDLRWFLPVVPARWAPGFPAGSTVLYSIAHGDAELTAGMNATKRRMVKRAIRAGYAVREARDEADRRAFSAIQRDTKRRHGLAVAAAPDGDPGEGQHWREWELPWMWLLVGECEGRVECGLGDGLLAGGMLEARAGASSERARRDGAFSLLSYEEARLARDRGYRWINLGGASQFKLEFAGSLGTQVPIHAWLAGAARREVGRRGEATWHSVRRAARQFARAGRDRIATAGSRPVAPPSAGHAGEVQGWSTRTGLPDDFEAAWTARLARAPHAHYAMRADWLRWEARHARHSLALLIGDPPAAIVLREARDGWISGWPWRWQAVVEDPERDDPAGLAADEALALLTHASRAAGTRRVRFHLPGGLPPGVVGYRHGSTVHQSLVPAEEVLFRQLDDAKRRNLKRAARDGFTVSVAETHEQFRAFQRLQRETEDRRGTEAGAIAAAERTPAAGEGWREWELPWQWLLVAERDGVVEAGSGFGFSPGSTLDYRTNASSLAAKKSGANVLLGWEAVRRGHERGFRRFNWGGATRFKRDLGGEPLEIWCALGGGFAWTVPNRVTASWQRMRPRVAGWWRSMRPRSTPK